jgi:hypothetical protein
MVPQTQFAVTAGGQATSCRHPLSPRQADILFADGSIPWNDSS